MGGLGLGFKEKTSRALPISSTRTSPASPTQQTPSRGPATDRLSAMKAAFRAQYQTQVRFFPLSFIIIIAVCFVIWLFRQSDFVFVVYRQFRDSSSATSNADRSDELEKEEPMAVSVEILEELIYSIDRY